MSENKHNKINHDVLKWIIIGIAGFVILVLIFGTGVFVGGMKARFSYRWAENYHRNFGGPKTGIFGDWRMPPNNEFIESHGVFGQILKIDSSTITIKGRDDIETIILIEDNTVIKHFRGNIKPIELKLDDFIVVIGEPNDAGQIKAKLIRVLPVPIPRH